MGERGQKDGNEVESAIGGPVFLKQSLRWASQAKTRILELKLTHDASTDEEHGQRRRGGDLCDLSRRKSE